MAMKVERQKRQLIDRVAKRVRDRMAPAGSALAERFVRQFYAHVPPDDIIKEGADNLYGAAMTLWSHAQGRKAGASKVRVYNPRNDEHGWMSAHSVVTAPMCCVSPRDAGLDGNCLSGQTPK